MAFPADRPLQLFTRHSRGRSHDLGKMDLGSMTAAFFTYPTVILYIVLAVASGYESARVGIVNMPARAAVAAVATFLVYALVWYLLHRFVLHSALLYRSPLTARLWKRIHYDHHQDAHAMAVLFGHPATTLPTIAGVTFPLGWLIGGAATAWFALFSGLVITLAYEFCHCCFHLNYTPRQAWLQRAKTLHMAHHFHNETGNFGIISFWPDRLLGTIYEDAARRPRSPTVLNLGYDAEEAVRYPWVATLSAPAATDVRSAGPEG